MRKCVFILAVIGLLAKPLFAQTGLAPCSDFVKQSISADGLPFDRQPQNGKVESFERVLRIFDNRMTAVLAQASTVTTRAEASALEESYHGQDPLCLDQWLKMNQIAQRAGLLDRKKIPVTLSRELDIQDALWKKLESVMSKWSTKPARQPHPEVH